MKRKRRKSTHLIFPLFIAIVYFAAFWVAPIKTKAALGYSLQIFLKMLPILGIVAIVMFLFNLIDDRKVKALIKKSPHQLHYLVMIILGVLSHGPIYAWYPLMGNFRDKGISNGSIAAFLYARSIKLPFFPLAAVYFGLDYIIILSLFLLIFSYLQALIFDKIIFFVNKE